MTAPAERKSVIKLRVASVMPIESSVNALPVGPMHGRTHAHAARGERNVRGDDDVVRAGALRDPIVGDIRTFRHDHALDPIGARHGHEGVGDHIHMQAVSLGHAIGLRLHRACVGIDKDANGGRFSKLFHACAWRGPILHHISEAPMAKARKKVQPRRKASRRSARAKQVLSAPSPARARSRHARGGRNRNSPSVISARKISTPACAPIRLIAILGWRRPPAAWCRRT